MAPGVLIFLLSLSLAPSALLASTPGLDQLLIDDSMDSGLLWQDAPPMSVAQDLVLLPPATLEFPRTALASIASHEVTIVNKHHNKTVYLNRVLVLPLDDGHHNDFHVPFVREQAVPPQGNFTFAVVFLPTRIGSMQSEIVVRTSFGQLKYLVQGVGVASPFKLVPLTQLVSYAGVNSNAAIIPDITLYNPFDMPLQITEIFSSGGKFYLELPTATGDTTEDSEARAQLWNISAYERRPVIRVRFVGSLVAGNYSAYIRMKVRCPADEDMEDISLVIPIRMAVRAMQPISLYPEKSLIHLGSVLLFEKHPLSINMHTSDTPDIGVSSLVWHSEVAIGESTTRFDRVLDCSDIVVGEERHVRLKLECDLDWPQVIGDISKQWDAFIPGSVMHLIGGITVNSTVGPGKQPQIHEIPLFAELIPGTGLELPRNVTATFPQPDRVSVGLFYLRNNFDSPIVVTCIQLEAAKEKGREQDVDRHPAFTALVDHLAVAIREDFPKLLKPGESWTLAPVDLPMTQANKKELRSFMAYLSISTNVTDALRVPLYGYSGKLTKLVLNSSVRTALGRSGKEVPSALKESEMVAVKNAELLDFGSVPLDVEEQRYVALWNDNPVPVELLKWYLPAMDILMSIFHVGCMGRGEFGANKESLLQPDDWCVFSFAASTSRAGEFSGSFQYETTLEHGGLPIRVAGNAGTLTVDPSALVMRNCFPKTICVAEISVESSYSEVVQLHDVVTHKDASVHVFTHEIAPNAVTKVGMLYFNPRMNRIEPPGYTNGYSDQIFDNTNDDGLRVLQQTAISMFRVLQERQFLLPLQLVTDRQQIRTSVAVNFIWPLLIVRDNVAERLVMAGRETSYQISLLNPSDESVAFWYFFTDDRMFISSLMHTPGGRESQGDGIMRRLGHRVLSTDGNRGQQKFVLRPGEQRNITIYLSGKEEPTSYASMFVLKNNFTFFEGAWQLVRIVQPQFKFGNRKPSSTTPLLFEVQDQPHACSESGSGSHVSARRTFTAKNTGLVPLKISRISINGEPCSGYGFVVFNCVPFVLAPNETHKIEISFVPDFTLSRLERKIVFHLDPETSFQYTLVGMVPQPMLDRCQTSVPRPWWEATLKKWALSSLATMAVIVATVAYFESLKILKDHSDATYRQRGPFQAPLDFKKLTVMKSSPTTSDATVTSSTTKDIGKAPKKKQTPRPQSLFDNKRFSWFINRSRGMGADAAAQDEMQVDNPKALDGASTTATSAKKASKNLGKSAGNKNSSDGKTAATASDPSVSCSKRAPTGVVKKEPVKKTKAARAKTTSTTTGGKTSVDGGAKPEVKKPAAQKTLQIVEPVETTAPEEMTHEPQHISIIECAPAGSQLLSPLGMTENGILAAIKDESNATGTSSYGKTPGRERKEKQQVLGKRHPSPSRANKVSLFQEVEAHQETYPPPTDPWTNACRGLLGQQEHDADIRGQFPAERFNQMLSELPRDVSGLNGGPLKSPEVNGGVAENPLGAIGTPVAKSYSLFDTENRNPIMQQTAAYHREEQQRQAAAAGYYENSFRNGNAVPSFNGSGGYNLSHTDALGPLVGNSAGASAMGYNAFNNMDMYGQTPNDLYAELEYQKQELHRLAYMMAMNQTGTGLPLDQSPAVTPLDRFLGWDRLPYRPAQTQHHPPPLSQPSRSQFSRRVGGPPPGIGPRRTDEGNDPNGNRESNSYDPLRSIWNQWNSNQ